MQGGKILVCWILGGAEIMKDDNELSTDVTEGGLTSVDW